MTSEPATIGRFQLLRVLGRSPAHVVHLAIDPLNGSAVALKHFSEPPVPGASADAFEREWEAAQRLDHPGILRLMERGHDEAAGPYLVSEYREGATLADLRRAGLTTFTILHLLIQLMRVLEAAESQGLFHGDVKPENVWVDTDGVLRLMDFGAGFPVSEMERRDQVFGSPGYAAPELIQGAAVSSASELYAFAVTAFHMLADRLPFPGETPEDLWAATLSQVPVFPRVMTPVMQRVFLKALHKTPAERYARYRDFTGVLIASAPLGEVQMEDLLGFLDGAPLPIDGLAQAFSALRANPAPPPALRASTQPMGATPAGALASPKALSSEATALAALDAALLASPHVLEYAIFDDRDELRSRSSQASGILNLAPSVYFHLSDSVGVAQEAGQLRSILLRTREGSRCLMFRTSSCSVAVGLRHGVHPGEFIDGISLGNPLP